MNQPVRRGADRRQGPTAAHMLAASPGRLKLRVSLEEMRILPTQLPLQLKTKWFCFPWWHNWRGPRTPLLGAGTRNVQVRSQCRGGLWGQLWGVVGQDERSSSACSSKVGQNRAQEAGKCSNGGQASIRAVGASALWLRPSTDPLCRSAVRSAHTLTTQLLSPKVKACDGSQAQRHQQHWPSGSRPNSEVQLRPLDTLSAVLQGGPRVTSKWQCHDAGQQDSAWRIARVSRGSPTHEHSWPWVRQRPGQADNCREQSPWQRQGAAVPGEGKGPHLRGRPWDPPA